MKNNCRKIEDMDSSQKASVKIREKTREKTREKILELIRKDELITTNTIAKMIEIRGNYDN